MVDLPARVREPPSLGTREGDRQLGALPVRARSHGPRARQRPPRHLLPGAGLQVGLLRPTARSGDGLTTSSGRGRGQRGSAWRAVACGPGLLIVHMKVASAAHRGNRWSADHNGVGAASRARRDDDQGARRLASSGQRPAQ
jgi:hypothetical protein